MEAAGLVTIEGDQVKHIASIDVEPTSTANSDGGADLESTNELSESDAAQRIPSRDGAGASADVHAIGDKALKKQTAPDGIDQLGPRAVFNVNVTLDSSLDIEKLQKQLELLKRYGAI